jgi:hypothetical protein
MRRNTQHRAAAATTKKTPATNATAGVLVRDEDYYRDGGK